MRFVVLMGERLRAGYTALLTRTFVLAGLPLGEVGGDSKAGGKAGISSLRPPPRPENVDIFHFVSWSGHTD